MGRSKPEPSDSRAISHRLHLVVEDAGGAAAFAEAIGSTSETVGKWLRKRDPATPDVGTILRICTEYHRSPTWLLLGNGPESLSAAADRRSLPATLRDFIVQTLSRGQSPIVRALADYSVPWPDDLLAEIVRKYRGSHERLVEVLKSRDGALYEQLRELHRLMTESRSPYAAIAGDLCALTAHHLELAPLPSFARPPRRNQQRRKDARPFRTLADFIGSVAAEKVSRGEMPQWGSSAWKAWPLNQWVLVTPRQHEQLERRLQRLPTQPKFQEHKGQNYAIMRMRLRPGRLRPAPAD